MSLDVPHRRVDDDKQTQNLDRLKPWADDKEARIVALEAGSGGGAPSGPAGGDLSGLYPNPSVPGLSGKADVGDSRFPSSGEKQALTGSSGTPGSGNKYVTDQDARLTDARPPTAHTHSQSDVTGLVTDLGLKAPLASPGLTGNPTAPTQSPGTGKGPNKSRLANTEYVDDADDLVRQGFVIRPQADFASVKSLPAFTRTGDVLTGTANGTLDETFGVGGESYPYLGRIQTISLGGTQPVPFRPSAITLLSGGGVAAVGQVDVAGYWLGVGGIWDNTNKLITDFGFASLPTGALGNPLGVTVDSSGNIYASDTPNNYINKYDSSGVYDSRWSVPAAPYKLTVSGTNIFVVCSNSNIYKYSLAGVLQATYGGFGFTDGKFYVPNGIAVDGSGNMFITDTTRLQKLSSSGVFQWKADIASGLNQGGVSVDSSGNIYVAEKEAHQIVRFDSTGARKATFGTKGSGNGQLSGPRDVKVNSAGTKLWVADADNQRVQIFGRETSSPIVVGTNVLVKDQAEYDSDNLVFEVSAVGGSSSKWSLVPRPDFSPANTEFKPGTMVSVKNDVAGNGGLWFCYPPYGTGSVVPGTTALAWERYRVAPTSHGDTHHALTGSDPVLPALDFRAVNGIAQVTTSVATKVAEITDLTSGIYLVYGMIDWVSIPASNTWATQIKVDGSAKQQLYVQGAITRVGQTVLWVGSVNSSVELWGDHPIGSSNATIGNAGRLSALRIG